MPEQLAMLSWRPQLIEHESQGPGRHTMLLNSTPATLSLFPRVAATRFTCIRCDAMCVDGAAPLHLRDRRQIRELPLLPRLLQRLRKQRCPPSHKIPEEAYHEHTYEHVLAGSILLSRPLAGSICLSRPLMPRAMHSRLVHTPGVRTHRRLGYTKL